jgi:hypothetical protein
MERSKKITH